VYLSVSDKLSTNLFRERGQNLRKMGRFFVEHIANIHICCMETNVWFGKLVFIYNFSCELLDHKKYCYVNNN